MKTKGSKMLVRQALGLALISVLIFGTAGRVSAVGTVRYAIPGGVSSGLCKTWVTACKLPQALSVAISGDRIWVAKGTYKPTVATNPADARTKTFALKNGVALYGGFAGTETSLSQRNWKTNLTTLSGETGGAGKADNAYHVVYASGVDDTAVLDGFTIKAGNANGSYPQDSGGGMANLDSSPTLRNLRFSSNSAVNGGAIYNNGSPTLTNVTFSVNTATNWGGGMFNWKGSTGSLTNVTFADNSAQHGGGMRNDVASLNLVNVTFSGNTATTYGGAMANYQGGLSLMNVTFSGNSAPEGGGIFNDQSSPTLTNVTFNANTAPDGNGGGMYNGISNPTLTNVTFSGNTAGVYGGGMYNSSSGPTLTNVSFKGNTAPDGNGGGMLNNSSAPTLTNVTFSSNSAGTGGGMHNEGGSSPTLTNVTFSNNTAAGEGGGMRNNSSGPTLTNVTFSNNTSSSSSAGGMYNGASSPTLTNVTFSGNKAANTVAGMYNDASSPTLTNVTFSGNIVDDGVGAISNLNDSDPRIRNSVFWGNGTVEIGSEDATSGPTIVDSIVAAGCPSGSSCNNVLSEDPKLGPLQNNGGFTKTRALGAGSAAIDVGGAHVACAPDDQRGVPRPQGPACDMGAYEVAPTGTARSSAAHDGWVLESSETSNVGGAINATAPTFNVGDHGSRSQYRAILSFNTGGLPDDAVIFSAVLTLRRESVTPLGSNPFNLLQGMLIDVRKGFFGSNPGLEAADFQAAGHKTVGAFKPTPIAGVYAISLPGTAYPYINKSAASGGLTQLRLRFKLDDDNDGVADFISFLSGNHGTASYRPTLIITYYVP